jgi:hypothetical protein
MQDLIAHPAVEWDEPTTFSSMHKKKLGLRHLSLFDRSDSPTRDHLLDQFAQTVCRAGIVAWKEIFKTWASALYIYSTFLGDEAMNHAMPPINRAQTLQRVMDYWRGPFYFWMTSIKDAGMITLPSCLR